MDKTRRMGMFFWLAMLAPLAAAESAITLPVDRAAVSVDSTTGDPLLMIWLSKSGREDFTAFSRQHLGTRVDVMVDGEVLTSPFIQSPIQSELLMISGGFSLEEAEALADKLAGAGGAVSVRPFAP
ncbi:MAG: hypothetical protein KIS86_19025 [Devosia sp.]|nr:hypothetical protein [Devosia sp.]